MKPHKLLFLFGLPALAVLATACIPIQPVGAPAAAGTVDVTVTYRQRILLPPGAVVTVQLVDVSRADAPATVLDEEVLTTDGTQQVPLPFTLSYDPAAIDPRFTYAVGARIEIDGQLRFINTTQTQVINNGVTSVELVLDMVQ